MFKFLEKKWSEFPINRLKEKIIDTIKDIKGDIMLKPKNELDTVYNLFDLKRYVENFDSCNLKQYAKHTIVFSGNTSAKLMIIGESPSIEEAIEQKLGIDKGGILLGNLLENIGIDIEKCYLTNCVFWPTPMNRKPNMGEISICKHIVLKQIEFLKPKAILLLGNIPLSMLFSENHSILKYHGQTMRYQDYWVLSIFNPNSVLKMPKQLEIVKNDLRSLQNFDLK